MHQVSSHLTVRENELFSQLESPSCRRTHPKLYQNSFQRNTHPTGKHAAAILQDLPKTSSFTLPSQLTNRPSKGACSDSSHVCWVVTFVLHQYSLTCCLEQEFLYFCAQLTVSHSFCCIPQARCRKSSKFSNPTGCQHKSNPQTQVLFIRRSSRSCKIISEVMRLNQKTRNSSSKLPENICLLLAWNYVHLNPPASPARGELQTLHSPSGRSQGWWQCADSSLCLNTPDLAHGSLSTVGETCEWH